jgi:glycoprotein-N-acetylgalactosamine 3-beta-galactosyltransferase
MTVMENLENKTKSINQTWAKDCDKYIFIAKSKYHQSSVPMEFYDENNLPLLHLPNYYESYERLSDKVFETFKYVYLNYNDFGWYVKADDDTFMIIDNLKSFLKDKNPSSASTFGRVLQLDEIESGYLQGGAGYVLSNKALKKIGLKLINDESFCLNSGREDLDVAKCLRKLSIYTRKSTDEMDRERFHPFNLKTIISGNYPEWFYGQNKNPVKKVNNKNLMFV